MTKKRIITACVVIAWALAIFSQSAWARFVTADPLYLENPETCVKSPTECNLYSYAKNDPLKYTDPSGKAAEDAFANRYDQLVLAGKIDQANAMLGGRAEVVATIMGTIEDLRPLPELLTLGGFAPLREAAQCAVGTFGRRAVGEAAESLALPSSARASNAASSLAQSARLRNNIMANDIAGGHAFEKHVIQKGEFPGIGTREQFSQRIEDFLNSPKTVSRQLNNGRTAYWNDDFGDILIRNPKSSDGGTFFKPDSGRNYFETVP